MFFGEMGMVLLECINPDGCEATGSVTCARYDLACGQRRYVDKRDMPKLSKEDFRRVTD